MHELINRAARVRLFSHNGEFRKLRNSNVLLYWPHGFGDWVQFGVVLPYLEQSNNYWITRFGDDTVAVFDQHPVATPIYLGVASPHCEDGGRFQLRHFCLPQPFVDGSEVELRVPISLYEILERHEITAMLWSPYPEPRGTTPIPYHTKARSIARAMVSSLPESFLKPLSGTITLSVDSLVQRLVEARLRNVCGFGHRRLCIIARNGYTSVGKNWGHLWRDDLPPGRRQEGEECRTFMRLMLSKCNRWCFLLMEDRSFKDSVKDPSIHAFAYSDVFGELGNAIAPFGCIMKCLVRLASLCVGVPAGPYHLAAQVLELPTIGLWIEHLPSWYDEPRAGLTHLIGTGAAKHIGAPGSFVKDDVFHYDARLLDSRIIPGEAVIEAAEVLLGSTGWT